MALPRTDSNNYLEHVSHDSADLGHRRSLCRITMPTSGHQDLQGFGEVSYERWSGALQKNNGKVQYSVLDFPKKFHMQDLYSNSNS